MKNSKKNLNAVQIEEAARLFSLLSEPVRLQILSLLMQEPKTVTELVEATGHKQGNISKHLGLLLDARLLSRTQEGNYARYAIAEPLLEELCRLVCERSERDARERLKMLRR